MLINFAAFQIGWFACILGAASGRPWTGVVVTACVVALHAWRSARPRQELILAGIVGVFGTAADLTQTALGVMAFGDAPAIAGLLPLWMVALWVNFSTTLNGSLRWLRHRRGLAAVLGLIAGPSTYYAGARLGALALHQNPTVSLVAIGIEWAVAMPAFMMLAERMAAQPSDVALAT